MSFTRARIAHANGLSSHLPASALRPGDETHAGIVAFAYQNQDTGEIITTYEDGGQSYHHPEEPITLYEAGGEYDDPSL